MTDGLLVYNYFSFRDDVLEYIYGYVPDVPFAAYNVIASTMLQTVILDKELQENGLTDTDDDKLTDWQEIRQDRITVNQDGSVELLTYLEYIQKYADVYVWHTEWIARYGSVVNKEGELFEKMMSEIYVLPIQSNPASEDSDGDGIMDFDESTWDGVDERYQKVGPLHKDTIEILFPEIKKEGNNKNWYPTYITIEDNEVVLHLRIAFEGDVDEKIIDRLVSENLTERRQIISDEIIGRLNDNNTFRDLIIDSVGSRWNGVYSGTKYDFYKGIQIDFSVEITEIDSLQWFYRPIDVIVKNGVCGVSNRDGEVWKTNGKRVVTLYISYCTLEEHENQKGDSCSNYIRSLRDVAAYAGIVAHEFGHGFGLADMYAKANNGYEPIKNEEIEYDLNSYGLPSGKGIMMNSGSATVNDIEMLLLAFVENTHQFYVPYGVNQKMSKAIKHDIEFRRPGEWGDIYIWNEENGEMEMKNEK